MRAYRPSNGSEGIVFEGEFCEKCEHEMKCGIYLDVMRLDVDDPNYPKEWVQDDEGGNEKCTAFTAKKIAAKIAEADTETGDLFPGGK